MITEKDILSVEETAALLHISRRQFEKELGKSLYWLEPILIGKRKFFFKPQIEEKLRLKTQGKATAR